MNEQELIAAIMAQNTLLEGVTSKIVAATDHNAQRLLLSQRDQIQIELTRLSTLLGESQRKQIEAAEAAIRGF